ncbi:MAG: hypothetical protein Q7S83_00545 [bacterium]|nr:hypothetical protein [bacterium]
MENFEKENPEKKDRCVDCGGKDGVEKLSGKTVPAGREVPVCRICKESRAVFYQKNEVPKPLPQNPDGPNRRCC